MPQRKSRTSLGGRRSALREAQNLISLWSALSGGSSIDVHVVASRLGIDEKSAGRLLELLATAHGNETDYLPLYVDTSEDANDVVALQATPNARGPVSLTEREFAALTSALNTLGVSADDPLRAKLAACCQAANQDKATASNLANELAAAYSSSNSDTLFEISKALGESLDLSFHYAGSNDSQPRQRTVSPERIYHDSRIWYLDAYDHMRRGKRTFRIDRMSDVRSIPHSPGSTPSDGSQNEPRLVELRFSDEGILTDRDWPGICVLRKQDGCITASIPYYESTSSWLVRRIASYGGRVSTNDIALRQRVATYAHHLLAGSQPQKTNDEALPFL